MNSKAIEYINKLSLKNIEKKTVIITGGNSGIGFESARYFCYLNAKVIIGVRNIQRGNDAIKKIRKENPNAKIELMEIDMSKEESIKNFANTIINKKIDIDIFYHNAGVYRLPFELIENRDIITSTNYYGQLILTSLLLPYLHSLNHEVKMIITSSLAAGYTNYNNLSLTPNAKQNKIVRYANSKLLDAYLFKYLYEKDKENIKYYLVHPGLAKTNLIVSAYKGVLYHLMNAFVSVFANPIWKSSLSAIKAVDDNSKDGLFYGPTHFFHFKGYPKVNKFLNKKCKNLDEIIKESEKVVCYQLIH